MAVLIAVLWLGLSSSSHAQKAVAPPERPSQQAQEGPTWGSLNASQKIALRPLERDWETIGASRKTQWLKIANRFPSMTAAEQARVQTRMEEWTKLTPRERGQARMNFKEAQKISAEDRKAKWEAYQALPPEQRSRLAARAKTPAAKASAPESPNHGASKSNLVPNPANALRPKAVGPSVAQAQPGATTHLITKTPSPPTHQHTGQAKIAVSPGLVDQATLLPKQGPQGPVKRSPASAAPAAASHP